MRSELDKGKSSTSESKSFKIYPQLLQEEDIKMDLIHVIELTTIIKDEFGWNKARCTCFTYFLLGMIVVCTVTLSKISTTFSAKTKLTSRQKRLKRFLVWLAPQNGFTLLFGKFVLKRLKGRKLTLSIDRTNWKFGASHINFLVVGVWYCGVSIPIYWVNLGAAGNSNTKIRILAIKDLLSEVSFKKIEWFLADREFIGENWFKYLLEMKIPFSIRIKDNVWLKVRRGKYYTQRKVRDFFSKLKPGKIKTINCCELYGCMMNLAGCLSSEGDLVIIATNKKPRKALESYKKRWSIECLFSCLKGRGFNFEDTHIVDPKRGDALLFVLSFSLFWSMQVGAENTQKVPLEIAKHGRPRVSIFRRGLDILRESIIQVYHLLEKLLLLIKYIRDPHIEVII